MVTCWLTGSAIFGNALGLETLGGGIIESWDDNRLVGNTVDGTPTTTHTNVGPPGPGGAAGPQGPQGEPAIKLMLALGATKVTARAGRRVALSYVATAAAKTTLLVTRGGKRVVTVRGTAQGRAQHDRLERQGPRQGRQGGPLRAHADGDRRRRPARHDVGEAHAQAPLAPATWRRSEGAAALRRWNGRRGERVRSASRSRTSSGRQTSSRPSERSIWTVAQST